MNENENQNNLENQNTSGDAGEYITPPNAAQGNYGLGQEIAQPGESNGLAIAAMVLGIVGVVLGCCSGVFGLPFGITGLVFSIIIMNKFKGQPAYPGKGMAIAGLILGIISILMGLLSIIAIIAMVSMPFAVQDYMNY